MKKIYWCLALLLLSSLYATSKQASYGHGKEWDGPFTCGTSRGTCFPETSTISFKEN